MKKVVGSGPSPYAREAGVKGLGQFTSAFLLFIVAIGIMGNIDKAKINVLDPDNALKYDNGIRVSTEFAPTLINNAPNLNLKFLETENDKELLLDNTTENINNFKDSLKSIANYITDKKELEIVNKQLTEYENDNFFIQNPSFGGKNPK